MKGWLDTHVGSTFATTAVPFNGKKKPISAQNFKTIAEMRVIYDLKKENTFSTQNASPTRNPNLKTGAKFRGISDFYLKLDTLDPIINRARILCNPRTLLSKLLCTVESRKIRRLRQQR